MTPAQVVQQAMACFNSGDREGLRAVFRPDVAWHAPGTSRFGGDTYGVDGVIEWLETMQGAGMSLTPEGVLEGRDHAFVFMRIAGERDGHQLDVLDAGAYRIEDGLIAEHWWLIDDLPAFEQFLEA